MGHLRWGQPIVKVPALHRNLDNIEKGMEFREIDREDGDGFE
jgi:hypothetical protein